MNTNETRFRGNQELQVIPEFNRPYLLNDAKDKEVKLCLTVRPSDEVRKSFEENKTSQGTNICMVIDTSDSMNIIVDRSNMESTGEKIRGEDGKLYNVVRGGISRLNMALASAKKVVDLLRPEDTLTCISYSSSVNLVFSNLKVGNKQEIIQAFDRLDQANGSGNTNISAALNLARSVLTRTEDIRPKRILFFTDGEPTEDTEADGIREGNLLANENITLECMGIGENEVNFPFLQKIASPSGGSVNLINRPEEFESVFTALFVQSQSVVITNARLRIEAIGQVKLFDYYRGTPDNVYLGRVNLDENKSFNLNLGQIEKNQMYKYYFKMNVPAQPGYNGPLCILKAVLEYYVPSLYGNQMVTIPCQVITTFGDSMQKASVANGDVEILYRLAEVKKLDEQREKAQAANNKELTIQYIQQIIEIYTALQKPNEIKAYKKMLEEYQRTNQISKATLNRATCSSSKSQESGIIEDIEDDEYDEMMAKIKQRRRKR